MVIVTSKYHWLVPSRGKKKRGSIIKIVGTKVKERNTCKFHSDGMAGLLARHGSIISDSPCGGMGSTCQTWWYSIRVRLSRLRARVGNNFEIVRSGGKKKNIGEKVLNNFQKGEEHSSFYFFEIKNHQTIFPICISIVYIYTRISRYSFVREKLYLS